jgi:hypothetical protein
MSRLHSRRRFLALVGAAGTGAAFGFGLAACAGRPEGDADPLAAVVGDFGEAARIGRVWLERQPEELSEEDVENELFDNLAPEARDADAAELRRLIDARIQAEYEQGHLRHVEDWALALTEIRLCALAAFAAEAAATPGT